MPKDPRAFLQLAEEHRRSGRCKEAIAVCLEGLGRHPGLDAARITLGRAYLESGQEQAARETLEEVFARLPEHHLAGKVLAEAQQRLGDRRAAEATCRALLVHYPRDRELEAILESVVGPAAPSGESRIEPGSAPERAAATTRSAPDPEPEYMPEDVDMTAASGAATAPPPAAAAVPPVTAVAGATPAAVARPVPTGAAPPMEVEAAPSDPSRAEAGSTRPPVEAAARALPEPPAPAAPPPAPAAGAGGDVLQTSTLADLYLRQGLVDRAIEVYKAMLRVDPGNQRARRRLEEIEAGMTSAAPRPAGAAAPAAVDPRAAAVARLEEWLDTMKRGADSARRAGR